MSSEKNYSNVDLPSHYDGFDDPTLLRVISHLPIRDRVQLQRTSKGFAGFFQRHPDCIKDSTPVWSEKPKNRWQRSKDSKLQVLPNCQQIYEIKDGRICFYHRDLALDYELTLPKIESESQKDYKLIDNTHMAVICDKKMFVFELEQAVWRLIFESAYSLPFAINSSTTVYWDEQRKQIIHQHFACNQPTEISLAIGTIKGLTLLGQQDILVMRQDKDPTAPSWASHEHTLFHYSLKTQKLTHVISNIRSTLRLDQHTCILNTTDNNVYRWRKNEKPEIIEGLTAEEIKPIDKKHLLCVNIKWRSSHDMYDNLESHYDATTTVFSLAENRAISTIKNYSYSRCPTFQASANGTIFSYTGEEIQGTFDININCETWTYPTKFELESSIKNAPTLKNF